MSASDAGSPPEVAAWPGGQSSRWLVALLPLLFGLAFYILNVTQFFTAAPGDLGDTRFNSVVLEHFYRLLAGQDKDIWTVPFFYPFEGTLTFSDNLFGSAPLYALCRFLGAPRALALDGWFTIGFILNYFAMLYVARRLGFSPLATAFVAFAFTFALPMLAQETHAQLVYRFATPLAFMALWDAFRRRRLMLLATALFWVAVQFYCSIYLGVFVVIVLGFATLGLLVSEWRGLGQLLRSPTSERGAALLLRSALAVLSLLALGWLLRPYQHYSDLYGFHRSWTAISAGLPELPSYLLGDREPDIALLLRQSLANEQVEHQLFLGFPLLGLFAYGAIRVVRTRHCLGLIALLVVAATFAGTLMVGDSSLYWFVWWLPGLNALRVMTRLILVVLVPVTFVAAIGLDRLLDIARRPEPARGAAIVALLFGGVLALAEVALYIPHSTPFANWAAATDAIKSRLPPNLPPDAVLLVTSPSDARSYWPTDVSAMVVAQDLGIATLNGYSGNFPPGYISTAHCATPAQLLAGYFKFANTAPAAQAALLARVVALEAPSPSGTVPVACPA